MVTATACRHWWPKPDRRSPVALISTRLQPPCMFFACFGVKSTQLRCLSKQCSDRTTAVSETVSSTRLVGEYSRVARPVGSDVRVAVPEWGEEQSGPWLVVPWLVVFVLLVVTVVVVPVSFSTCLTTMATCLSALPETHTTAVGCVCSGVMTLVTAIAGYNDTTPGM